MLFLWTTTKQKSLDTYGSLDKLTEKGYFSALSIVFFIATLYVLIKFVWVFIKFVLKTKSTSERVNFITFVLIFLISTVLLVNYYVIN